MKYFLLIIFFIFSFSGCTRKNVVVPAGIIQEKEMVSILSDIHIVQSARNNIPSPDSLGFSTNDYINSILQRHQVERKDFMESLRFYSDNPEILKEVYDSVMTGLSRMEAAMEK